MFIKSSKRLPRDIHLKCFSCNQKPAIGVFNFDWDGMSVQICLCEQCASLKEESLVARSLYGSR